MKNILLKKSGCKTLEEYKTFLKEKRKTWPTQFEHKYREKEMKLHGKANEAAIPVVIAALNSNNANIVLNIDGDYTLEVKKWVMNNCEKEFEEMKTVLRKYRKRQEEASSKMVAIMEQMLANLELEM